jgi:endonuclease/exonuclease/phosphatase family metal-dependent hydrolase
MRDTQNVYKTVSRRPKMGSFILGLSLAAFTLLNANCGNFKSNQSLHSTADGVGAVSPDSPSDGTQVWIPTTPTPTPSPGATATPEPLPTATPQLIAGLRVMTYNIKAIPCLRDSAVSSIGGLFGVKQCPLVNDVWTKANRERVANLIINIQTSKNAGDEPDVILLQEAFTTLNDLFDDSAVRSIPALTGYPYFAWGPAPKVANGISDYWNLVNQDRKALRGLLSSGLLILSKHPIVSTKMIEYGDVCTIDDCNSNKGVLLAKIQHPAGFSVDVVNSHWQAGTANDSVRAMQADLYKSFVATNQSSSALILGGDYNMRLPNTGHQAEVLLTEMALTHSGAQCLAPETQCSIPNGTDASLVGGNALDHIFYKLSDGLSARVTRGWMPGWTFSGGLLSDHFPLIVDLNLYY